MKKEKMTNADRKALSELMNKATANTAAMRRNHVGNHKGFVNFMWLAFIEALKRHDPDRILVNRIRVLKTKSVTTALINYFKAQDSKIETNPSHISWGTRLRGQLKEIKMEIAEREQQGNAKNSHAIGRLASLRRKETDLKNMLTWPEFNE